MKTSNVATLARIDAIAAIPMSGKLSASSLASAVALSFTLGATAARSLRWVLDHNEKGMQALCDRFNTLRADKLPKQAASEFAQVSRELHKRAEGKALNVDGNKAPVPTHHIVSRSGVFSVAQGAPVKRTAPPRIIDANAALALVAQVRESFKLPADASADTIRDAIRNAAARLAAAPAVLPSRKRPAPVAAPLRRTA